MPDRTPHPGDGLQQAQRGSGNERNYLIRPVLRCVALVGGALGTTCAYLSGHQIIAIGTLLVPAAIIAFDLWIAKRRDDAFSEAAARNGVDLAVLHALTVHEAVRSGLLSSADTVRILRTEPHGQDGSSSSMSQSIGQCESPIGEATSPTLPRAPRIVADPPDPAA
jgi:hypothetical protein